MSILKELEDRSGDQCELCGSKNDLSELAVEPIMNRGSEDFIHTCSACKSQIQDPELVEVNHWRCLNDSMWSEVEAVKVVSWRLLNRLNNEGWAQDLLDMMYLEDETLKWAKAGMVADAEGALKHKDANGVTLNSGDTVVLIKDLVVKGANFTAKRGTAVRSISLDSENPEHIEGRVNGQNIVILTQYVKKS